MRYSQNGCCVTKLNSRIKPGMVKCQTLLIIDRKSTRLNSSHLVSSYAVFCLKKKMKHRRHSLKRPACDPEYTDSESEKNHSSALIPPPITARRNEATHAAQDEAAVEPIDLDN